MSVTGHFTASVQYNDWTGTTAADNSDDHSIHDLLLEKRLIADNECLLSVSFYSADGAGFVRVAAYLLEDADKRRTPRAALEQTDPIRARRVDLNLTAEEFLELFKSFDIVLCHRSLAIEGREFIAK